MIEDLKTDHTEAKHAEEVEQKDYETLMATSQESREKMAASITGKESSSAEWTEKIENAKTDSASTTEALGKLAELIAGLHADCDFLVANYDSRKGHGRTRSRVSRTRRPCSPARTWSK